jgi:hypothetical protein
MVKVSQRAYQRDRWRLSARQSYGFDLLVALILFALSWAATNEREFPAEARSIGLGLAALVGGHFLMRLWRFLVTVPKEQHDELIAQMERIETKQAEKHAIYTAGMKGVQDENAKLKNLLEEKKRDQAFADQLTEQYRFGLHSILNWPIGPSSDVEWPKWKDAERQWTEHVTQMLKRHGCSSQEISHFREIHEVERKGYHSEVVIDHHKSMFSIRLYRLKTIINLYAETKILIGT